MVYAFLAPDDPVHARWTPVPIDTGPLFGVNPNPHIYVYRLLGAAADPTAWQRTTIDTIGTHEAQAVDLDGDGRPDVIGHQENMELVGKNGPVNAWRNETR